MNHGDDGMIEESFTDKESDNEADGSDEYSPHTTCNTDFIFYLYAKPISIETDIMLIMPVS